jgi:hypothetical protein
MKLVTKGALQRKRLSELAAKISSSTVVPSFPI